MSNPSNYDQANLVHRAFRRMAMIRPVALTFSYILPPIDRWVFRLSGGRQMATNLLTGLPLVSLTTTGAKSGQPRTVPLVALQDGDRYVLIASNWGKAHHPAWYHNLRAHPEVTLAHGRRVGTYIAREATANERRRYWEMASRLYPGYDLYRQRAGERVIPVVVLTPKK